MDNLLEEYGGLLGVNDSEKDYQLLAGELDLPTPRFTFGDKRLQYNQNNVHKNSCTLHGALGIISDQTGYEFTIEDFKQVLAQSMELGFDPAIGWYLKDAMDLCRKFASKKLGMELVSFAVDIDSEEAELAYNKGYSIFCGYNGNSAYRKDFVDGELSGTSFGARSCGHAIRNWALNDTYFEQIDNYKGRKDPNVYKLKRANLAALIDSKTYFRKGYVVAIKEDMDKPSEAIQESRVPAWGVNTWAKALKLNVVDRGRNPLEIVGDANDEDLLFRMKLLNVKEGNITLIRLLVAYDRMGALK